MRTTQKVRIIKIGSCLRFGPYRSFVIIGDLHKDAITKGKFRESDQVFFQQIELKTKNSTKRQQSCRLVEFLVFNSAFGRHKSLINTDHIIISWRFSC